MYRLQLKRVPESGAYTEEGLSLALEELGLKTPFAPSGVKVSLQLRRIYDKVFGQVRAEAEAGLECGRCLRLFQAPVRADFQVHFEPLGDGGPADDDEGLVAFHDGESLDLGEEIRQELELQLPFAPLCRTDCKGLCARCGADLNLGPCACPPQPAEGPFSALDKLKT